MSEYIRKMDKVPTGVLLLSIFTCVMLVVSLVATSTGTQAEVAVAPSSYVETGEGVTVVQGEPAIVEGKAVVYHKTNIIPIKPEVQPGTTSTSSSMNLNTHCHAVNSQNESVCDTSSHK